MFKKNHKPKPSAAIEEFNSSSDTVSLRAKLENERMSRRQALRKMGVMSGVAVLSLLSVDDLARLASKQLASSGGDSEMATSVAKSLRSAGVAFADPFTTTDPNSSYWDEGDCAERCLINTGSFLFKNIPDQNQNSATSIESFCLSNYASNDYSGYGNCLVSGILPLAPPDIAGMAKAFLNCCKNNCASNKEGSQVCQPLLQPGTPV